MTLTATAILFNLKDEILRCINGKNMNDLQVIGQEENGTLLLTWVEIEPDSQHVYYIGMFDRLNTKVQVLHKLNYTSNCAVIQATLNHAKTILVYVTKTRVPNEEKDAHTYVYEGFIHSLIEGCPSSRSLGVTKCQQIMAQFLYRRRQNAVEKLLLLTHQHSVTLYQVEIQEEDDKGKEIKVTMCEQVVRMFTWAQWDAVNQCLYYIHYRRPPQPVEGEVVENKGEDSLPILSALQFHDDLPHETVLNIPLNLPQLPNSVFSPCGVYEDDTVPLRIHDCSLDLTIVADHRGVVCICHHYLYQPVKPPQCDQPADLSNSTVHFAYSVTLLHHGRAVHCTVPGVSWADAAALRPSFVMYGDQHMVVFSPGLFLHLLDIGPSHEPCCHIVLPNQSVTDSVRLAPLQDGTDNLLDLNTLNVVQLQILPELLVEAFLKSDIGVENRISILHYFIVHLGDMDLVSEIFSSLAEKCMDLNITKIFQEVLIGGSYASVLRSLPSDALPLVDLLPLTTWNPTSAVEVKLSSQFTLSLSQECLWNPAVMLLSPQQRLVPYRGDMWTRLWDFLSAHTDRARFRPSTVVDKLMVSLVCYQPEVLSQCVTPENIPGPFTFQPEALSRCSTPLSPGASVGVGVANMCDLSTSRSYKQTLDPLPFFEVEPSAASKQEHVISVNLREVSMHLLKQGYTGGSRGRDNPMQVHAVATRYAGAQLEHSRLLCQLVTRAVSVNTATDRGFSLVDQMSDEQRRALFVLLERYCLAVEGLAFPLPQGFPSFLTYLGYRTQSFSCFLQYVQAGVLQLQIDVMKAIMKDLPDSGEGLQQKLRLLQLLPRSRGKRLLNQWQHPASLMLRARQHAQNILSGVEGAQTRSRGQVVSRGLAAFPSENRLSPLDTFLDLLTAKANLAELDFNLLIAATTSSTEEFYD